MNKSVQIGDIYLGLVEGLNKNDLFQITEFIDQTSGYGRYLAGNVNSSGLKWETKPMLRKDRWKLVKRNGKTICNDC